MTITQLRSYAMKHIVVQEAHALITGMHDHLNTLPNFDKNKVAERMGAKNYISSMKDVPAITLDEFVELLMGDVEAYDIPPKGLSEPQSFQMVIWCLSIRLKSALQSYYAVFQTYNSELQYDHELRITRKRTSH